MDWNSIVVIDIETVSQYSTFEKMDQKWQQLWTAKTSRHWEAGEEASGYYKRRGGILSEFGKIICIGMGFFSADQQAFRVHAIYDKDEKVLLQRFISFVTEMKMKTICWAGHNIREFDLPFICRRLLINSIPLPDWLDIRKTKPWDDTLLDTFQLWRFGDYKNFTSLQLLATVLHVEGSKDDFDGSKVGDCYWSEEMKQAEDNLKIIANYCAGDVWTTANVLLRLHALPVMGKRHLTISIETPGEIMLE